MGTLKQRALEGAQGNVDALHSECEKLIRDLVAAHKKSVVGQLDGILENYSAVYAARVQEPIAELDAEETRLDQHTRYAEQDVAMIRERTAALDCQTALINGQAKALPVIGNWAIDWFKGIRKA